MGPGQKFLTRVGSGQPPLVWVWKIFPKNPSFLNFSLRVKEISSGLVKTYPGQRRVGLLFNTGQKFAQV